MSSSLICGVSPCSSKVSLKECVSCQRSACGRHRRPFIDVVHQKSTNNKDHDSVMCTICAAQHSCLLDATSGEELASPHEAAATTASLPQYAIVDPRRCPPWICSMALVTFDLNVGQVIDYLYPPLPLSVQQESELAFMSFPDANTKGDDDAVHCFTFLYDPAKGDMARTSCVRHTSTTSTDSTEAIEPCVLTEEFQRRCAVSSNRPVELFGMTLFHQKKDPSIPRGALQRAVVILSTWPFPSLFSRVLSIFRQDVFDTNKREGRDAVRTFFNQMESEWPAGPLPSERYNSLPVLSWRISFTTPSYSLTEDVTQMLGWNHNAVSNDTIPRTPPPPQIESPNNDSDAEDSPLPRRSHYTALTASVRSLYNYALCAAEASSDAGAASDDGSFVLLVETVGALNDDVVNSVLETQLGWNPETKVTSLPTTTAQWHELAEALSGIAQQISKTGSQMSPRSASVVSSTRSPEDIEHTFSESIQGANNLSDISAMTGGHPHSLALGSASSATQHLVSRLKDLISNGRTLVDGARRKEQNDERFSSNSPLSASTSQSPQTVPVYAPFQDLNLHSSMFPHIGRLWKLWESVIRGHDMGVFGPETPNVSFAALGLVSLIAPLPLCGIVRPFVTINTKELDNVFGRAAPPAEQSTIVAMCNPFFVRHFAAWSDFLSLGPATREASANKKGTDSKVKVGADEKRAKLQFKLKDAFYTKTVHYAVKTDPSVVSSVAKWDAHPSFVVLEHSSSSETLSASNPLLPNTILRDHFLGLTKDFLVPLEHAIHTICIREQLFFLPESTQCAYLNANVILAYLDANSVFSTAAPSIPSPARFRLKPGRGKDLYEAFLSTPTFARWLGQRKHHHFRRFLFDMNSAQGLLDIAAAVSGRSLEGRVTMDILGTSNVLRRWADLFEEELNRVVVDIVLVDKMTSVSASLVELIVQVCAKST